MISYSLSQGAIAATLAGLFSLWQAADVAERKNSPDQSHYATLGRGLQIGMGEEAARIEIHRPDGTELAIAHIWLVEPDGTRRVGIRGCERWGWIDNSRVFCEGSINPSSGIYLAFDAFTGAELNELIGNEFSWSPDRRHLANFGNVPHFSPAETKSDSLELQGRTVYPANADREQRLFRSVPVWADESDAVAVVEHRRGSGGFVLVVIALDGHVKEYRLNWDAEPWDWPERPDFSVEWNRGQIVVRHRGASQTVAYR